MSEFAPEPIGDAAAFDEAETESDLDLEATPRLTEDTVGLYLR